MEKIDLLDKKILSILSKNARIPFKDVAAECNVSRAAIHQRVQHLIDADVITGSGFDVNPKSLGYSTCTYVGITLEKGSMYKDVVERLKHIPEVVECHFTTGPYTMLVKLYARDNEQLMAYVREISGNYNALNYGLLMDGKLCAFSVGMIRHWWEGTNYNIEEFCVAPELQGQGIGSRFMGMIENDIRRKGLAGIFLQTDKDKPAYRFYKKNGFGDLELHVSLYKNLRGES